MNTQKFRAPDMMAALETVQNQLGPHAVVLSVREVFDESCWKIWKRPGVEVLATVDQEASGQPLIQAEPKPVSDELAPPAQSSPQDFKLPVESGPDLYDRYLKKIPPETRSSAPSTSAVMREVREHLSHQDVVSSFRDQLLETCQQVLPPQVLQDRFRVENHLEDLIEAEIEIMPAVKVGRSQVVCLIGSGGSGKTSTTAKLAAAYQQQGHQKVVWVTADTIRAGAIAEARAYTDNLEIPFHKAYTPEEFGGLVNELREDALVLADLFDCNPHRQDQVQRLEEYLDQVPLRDTYLVLSASTKVTDLISAVEAFQSLGVNGLIPTKLDQTATYGNLISAIWKSRCPLVFTTAGPKVTDPLQKPDPRFLAEMLFQKQETYL